MAVSPPVEIQARPILRCEPAAVTHSLAQPRSHGRAWAVWAVIALFFGLLGGVGIDLDATESRLGLAAGETFGPLGQVFGYWAVDVWPAQLWPSKCLASLEFLGRPTTSSIRWPAILAGLLTGLILWRSAARSLGSHAAFWTLLCWSSMIGVIDHSALTGLDMVQTLSIVGAIERLQARGRDFTMGWWLALAFLSGGIPPVLMIGLAMLVIGRPDAGNMLRPALPLIAVITAWSIWVLLAGGVEVWASALTLPLTRSPDWSLALKVFVIGLPWSPFACWMISPQVRSVHPTAGRAWVGGWVQAGLASAICGTIIPGLATPARGLALVGLAVTAGSTLHAAWSRRIEGFAHGALLGLLAVMTFTWLLAIDYGCYIWIMSMPYYRTFGILMALLAIAVSLVYFVAAAWSSNRAAALTLLLLAVGGKLVHVGYFAPEWNYRHAQGPWARAVAQWIPRRSTIYTFHPWPADFAFYLKRPIRQFHSPEFLRFEPKGISKYVLLLDSEFQNWPESALPIIEVARFIDPNGRTRVLARTTDGPMPLFSPNAGYQASRKTEQPRHPSPDHAPWIAEFDRPTQHDPPLLRE